MSHKRPPEDRAPGLKFAALILGLMGLVWFVWLVVVDMVT